MHRDEIDTVLSDIFSDIFDLPSSEFNYETSPVSLENWDSLAQINLIAAVQEEFDLDIPPEQQLDMLSFELFGDALAKLLGASSS
jgi:acyl carrier protein